LGIKTDKGKILVDKFYQTNVPGIYAIGDCVPVRHWHMLLLKKVSFVWRNIGVNEKEI
jgi:dihydrolipoamide dehydrogenase